ncbi:uncharacterized protein LOC130715959 [Lotus japonicus]|uniref:uncharacterized protein LOC130715959 n=1 Tax=Lotus japonicus TaxID=34305 RepID=UPI002590D58D|nr:uncharacterized protein LOC130715959 [Lotus japonicus]
MALSSAFHERLEQMDRTRIQRLSQLQAEKELQAHKSRILASKLENIRTMEQRCFLIDRKIASRNFEILTLKSQIENLEAKHDSVSQELRPLQDEVEVLEEMRQRKDRFYEAKRVEMKEFKETADNFLVKCQLEVENLKNRVNELRSSFMELKSNNGNSSDSEIAAAEMRRMELLAEKERVCRNVESNHQIKAQLQKQLQSILMTQAQEKGIELKTTQLNSQAHSLGIGYLDCISMGTSQAALSSSVP